MMPKFARSDEPQRFAMRDTASSERETTLQAVYIQSVGVTGDEKLNFYLMESIYAFHAFEVSLAIW